MYHCSFIKETSIIYRLATEAFNQNWQFIQPFINMSYILTEICLIIRNYI